MMKLLQHSNLKQKTINLVYTYFKNRNIFPFAASNHPLINDIYEGRHEIKLIRIICSKFLDLHLKAYSRNINFNKKTIQNIFLRQKLNKTTLFKNL